MAAVSVTRSTIIDAPVDRVWETLRDFNSQPAWQPVVAESRIEGTAPPDSVGAVRLLRLSSGAVLREQLLALDDRTRTATWCILDSPIPLNGYLATITLRPVTDGNRTFWYWQARFEAPPGREAELAALIGDQVFAAGQASLRATLAGNTPARGTPHRPAGPAHAAEGIVVARHGGPDVLAWGATPAPAPGPGELCIRHTAIGVNFIDVYCRTGYFALMPLPGTPGLEAAGTVLDAGPGVAGFAPGDRVAYACPPTGAYAEARTIDAALVVPLPDEIPDEHAAAGLLKGLTAEFLLHVVHPVRAGEKVLVHAATGGVGSLLAAWAAHLGATVIGTVGSAEKARAATRAGHCAHVVLVSDADWPAQVRAAAGGRGVDVAFDAIGKPSLMGSYEALAPRGHLVSFGQAGGDIGPIEVARFAEKSARLTRPNYGHYMGTPADVRRGAARLFALARAGVLDLAPRHRFPLREAAAAHRALEGRATTGSIILLP